MKSPYLLLSLLIGLGLGYWFASSGEHGEAGASAELAATDDAAPANKEASVSTEKVQSGDDSVQPEETAGISEAWLESLESKGSFERYGILHERLKTVAPSEFQSLLKSLAGMQGSALAWQAQGLITARWAETDPTGLRRYIDTQPINQQWGMIRVLYSTWAEKDVDSALAASREIGNRNLQLMALSSIGSSIAQKDPARAISIVQENSRGSINNNWAMRQVYQEWAKRDPQAARQAALNMEEGTPKSQALIGALGESMASEPKSVLAWLDSLPADSVVQRTRRELFNNLVTQDFEAAKEYIESRATLLSQKKVIEDMHFWNIAWAQDAEKIGETIDWLGTVAKGQLYNQKFNEIISSLADSDSNAAIEYIRQMPPGAAKTDSIGSIAQKLAEQNPAKALEFVNSLEYENERERALNNLSWGFAQNGIQTTSALVSASEDPAIQRTLARGIAQEWSTYNPSAALEWVESLKDNEAKTNGLEAILGNLAQEDPAQAMDYIENSIEDAETENAYRSLFSDWSRLDPEAAVEWLDKIPEEQAPELYLEVTQNYLYEDPLAASKWIGTLEESPERDQSVKALIDNITDEDPEAGYIWALTLGDDEQRSESLEATVKRWVDKDPKEAKKAIQGSDISEEQKISLLDIIEGKQ